MKICKDCEFMDMKVMQTSPDPRSLQNIPVCTNSECRDPVSGEAVPAMMARQQLAFCGFEAKYFKLREVKLEPSVIKLVD